MAAYIAAYLIIQRKRKRNRVSQRILKDLNNPFCLDEVTFKKKFSLNRKGVLNLAELLTPIMRKNQGYPVELQILSSLQVLTQGSFQNRVGEDQILTVSQATVSRSLDAFLDAILEIEHLMVEFPSLSELAFTEQKFYGQSKISNILGVVDCFPIVINKPHVDDHIIYMNRKKEYAINVQLVCDSNMYINDAVVHWPGSASNSLIWKCSSLRALFKNNKLPNRSFLLGGNSYPLEPWLLVPYEDCLDSKELIFNDHVNRALDVVRLCTAMLRTRFRCIHPKCGPLHYTPEKCSKIIAACVILHNICVKMNISLSEPVNYDDLDINHTPGYDEEEIEEENVEDDIEDTMLRNEAMCIRDDVARQLIS